MGNPNLAIAGVYGGLACGCAKTPAHLISTRAQVLGSKVGAQIQKSHLLANLLLMCANLACATSLRAHEVHARAQQSLLVKRDPRACTHVRPLSKYRNWRRVCDPSPVTLEWQQHRVEALASGHGPQTWKGASGPKTGWRRRGPPSSN